MAIYHCNIKVISQDKGKPAVAAVYRVGQRLATLKKHIEQADIYMKYKDKKTLPDLDLFTAEHSHLKCTLNGKTTYQQRHRKQSMSS